MKFIKNIPVYLLALIYLVFGSNHFLHFIPMPPMAGDAGNFVGLLFTSGYLLVVKILEVTLAVLLLVPKTRAVALLLIAPISINILATISFSRCGQQFFLKALLLSPQLKQA